MDNMNVRPGDNARSVYIGEYDNKGMKNVRTFYFELRQAVIKDMTQSGKCSLMEYIINRKITKIDLIAFCVFRDIEENYQSDKMDVAETKTVIPYAEEKTGRWLEWKDCPRCGCYSVKCSNIIAVVEDCWHILRTEYERTNNAHKGVTISIPIKDGDHPEKQAKTSWEPENRYEDHRDHPSEKQQERYAPEPPAPIQNDLEADRIIERAKKEAERIVNEARGKAQTIEQDARYNADRIIESAKAQAQQQIDDANKKTGETAKEQADKLVERYLKEEQENLRRSLNNEMAGHTEAFLRETEANNKVHAEMFSQANLLQQQWVGALNETQEKLEKLKSEFYDHMSDWKKSLNPKEFMPIAMLYSELYNITRRMDTDIISVLTDDPDGKTEISELSTNKVLQKLQHNLTVYTKKLEKALNSLDLYTFVPQKGEEFNPIMHSPQEDDGESDYSGWVISYCVVPGVARRTEEGYDDDILVPAEVVIEERQ